MAEPRYGLEAGQSAGLIGKPVSTVLARAWRVASVPSSTFHMQRIGAELRFSATLREEPTVELALALRLRAGALLMDLRVKRLLMEVRQPSQSHAFSDCSTAGRA